MYLNSRYIKLKRKIGSPMQTLKQNWHLVEEMTERLKTLNPYKIILFGSYARGNPHQDSDLDVVVILDSDEIAETFAEKMDRRRPVSRAVREIRYKIPMDILVYSKAEIDYMKKEKDDLLREMESTGKVLYER